MPVKDTQNDLAFQNKEIEVFDINRQADPFTGNQVLASAYRKAERIALAVHLVTNAAPDTTSVKQSVRAAAQHILAHLLAKPHGFANSNSQAFVTLVAHVRSVLSLLDIAHIEGHLSLTHLQLIKRAYIDMLTFLSTSAQEGDASAVHLSTTDLSTVAMHKGHAGTHKGHIKDNKNIKDIKDTETENTNKNDTTKKRQTPLAQQKAVGNRRMAIIDILSAKPYASVQDISKKLPTTSPKTIQRELAQLVEDGVAVKEGERRWTTYALSGE